MQDRRFAEELAVLSHKNSTELKEVRIMLHVSISIFVAWLQLQSQLLKMREENTLALEQKEAEVNLPSQQLVH